jgi:hypothetical protein
MLKGISLQRKHLATSLSASSVSFFLINHRIEGFPPGVDLPTKKGEIDERTAKVEGPVAEEWDCGTGPPSEALDPVFLFASSSSFLRASAASLLLPISMSDWFAIRIISGLLFGQASTSNLGILARWYFKQLIPAKIFLSQRLHVNICLLGSCTGSPYTHIEYNASDILFR